MIEAKWYVSNQSIEPYWQSMDRPVSHCWEHSIASLVNLVHALPSVVMESCILNYLHLNTRFFSGPSGALLVYVITASTDRSLYHLQPLSITASIDHGFYRSHPLLLIMWKFAGHIFITGAPTPLAPLAPCSSALSFAYVPNAHDVVKEAWSPVWVLLCSIFLLSMTKSVDRLCASGVG